MRLRTFLGWVIAVSTVLSSNTRAQSPADQPDSSPPKRVELTGRVEVPIALVNGVPIVETRVNGKGPYHFGIETGANFVIVSPELAKDLGLPHIGAADATSYHVDSFTIGAAKFIDMPVEAMRVAQLGIDGVLGLPLYRDLLLTIDYPQSRLRLERGALPAPDGATVLPLTHAGPFWAMPITIGGTTMPAVLDTRSTGGLGFTPDTAAKITFADEPKVVGRARGAAIAETEVKAAHVKGDVRIGRYTLAQPFASIRALPPGFPNEPIIGTQVLSQFVLTLDQQQARLRLDRSGDPRIVLSEPSAAPPAGKAPAAPLADYVGTYQNRRIRLSDGKLLLQRDNASELEMVTTGRDTFSLAIAPQARIEFVRDAAGAVTSMKILNSEGQWETLKRGGSVS